MAHANKRTSIVLAGLAAAFVVIIIILCVIPRNSRCKPPNCEQRKSHLEGHADVITDATTSTTTSSTPGIPFTTKTSPTPPTTSTTTSIPLTTKTSPTTTTTTTQMPDGPVDSEDNSTTISTTPQPVDLETTSITTGENMGDPVTTTNYTSEEDMPEGASSTSSTEGDTTETQDTSEAATTIATPEDDMAAPQDTSKAATTIATPEDDMAAPQDTSETSTTANNKCLTAVSPKEDDNVCQTIPCKRMAAKMLHMKDNGLVEPCEDFYQYSCGGVTDDSFFKPQNNQLITKNLISAALKKLDTSDALLNPLKTYYDSCLNHLKNTAAAVRKARFQDIFKSTGYGFKAPDHTPEEEGGPDTVFDLTEILTKMIKMQFTPFFDILVDVDDQDPETFVFKVTPPLSVSPLSDGVAKKVCLAKYHRDVNRVKQQGVAVNINQAYVSYTTCMKSELAEGMVLSRMKEAVTKMGLMEDIDDEGVRATLLSTTSTNTNYFLEDIFDRLPGVPALRYKHLKKEYSKRQTLEEFYSELASGVVKWKSLIEGLIGDTVPDDMYIQVYFYDELKNILNKLDEEMSSDPINMQNMLLFMWSEQLYTDLVEPVDNKLSSPDYCYRAATKLMEDSTSYLYMKNLPDLQNKTEQLKGMIDMNQRAALSMLKSRGENGHTQQLITKLNNMKGVVPSLETAREIMTKNLEDAPLNLDPQDFLTNSKILLERYRTLMYRNVLGVPNEEILWSQFLLPHSPSGVVSYALNKFLIPLGAMEVPLYTPNVPAYLNYAGLGHMVAHELMHGFDATGVHYDGTTRSSMIIPRDLTASSTECLAKGVSQGGSHGVFDYQAGDNHMKFELTSDHVLNELMADSGATRLAWEAYLTNFIPAVTTTLPPFSDEPANPMRRRRRLLAWYPASEKSQRRKRELPPTDPASDSVHQVPPTDPASDSVHQVPPTDPASDSVHQVPPTDPPSVYVHKLPSIKSLEETLPYLEMEPIQLYFLQFAQSHCSGTSELDMLGIMEGVHLPPHLRVNMVLKNDPLFAAAFKCPDGATMKKDPQCPFLLK